LELDNRPEPPKVIVDALLVAESRILLVELASKIEMGPWEVIFESDW